MDLSGRRARHATLAATALLLVSVGPPGRGASAHASARGMRAENPFASPLWDDGKAEYSIYTGVTSRYGQPRPTEARMVVVKEDLVRATLVKSDSGPVQGKTIPAIKLNWSADFETGTYTYHQAVTVMFDRASLGPLKETMVHHELCGITTVRVAPEDGHLVHRADSYWDGEATRTVRVNWPEGLPLWWDALPVSLRGWAGRTQPFELRVVLLPSQVSGRSPLASTQPVDATLRLVKVEPLTVPAGRFTAARFSIETKDGVDTFWFDARTPYVMLRVDTHEGRSLALKKSVRLDYWNHHMNGDERLVE